MHLQLWRSAAPELTQIALPRKWSRCPPPISCCQYKYQSETMRRCASVTLIVPLHTCPCSKFSN